MGTDSRDVECCHGTPDIYLDVYFHITISCNSTMQSHRIHMYTCRQCSVSMQRSIITIPTLPISKKQPMPYYILPIDILRTLLRASPRQTLASDRWSWSELFVRK